MTEACGAGSGRQTELERQFPLHVVCSWLGNTEAIAKKNYLLVKESDFEKAAAVGGTESGTLNSKSGTAGSRTETQGAEEILGKTLVKTKKASVSAGFKSGGQGIRTTTKIPGKIENSDSSGTESGTVVSKTVPKAILDKIVLALEFATQEQLEKVCSVLELSTNAHTEAL